MSSPLATLAGRTAERPPEYWLGALDEPTLLYLVIVTLRAGEELSNEALGRLYCQLQTLAPLHTGWRNDQLVCDFAWVAPSAEAAAWKTVERLRGVDGAVLVQVEAGRPGEPGPQVVLTSETARRRGRDDDEPEAALCA